MDFDAATHTASNYKVLSMETDPMRPAWPFVLPDNGGVVFTRTDGADFSGEGAGLAGIGGRPGQRPLHRRRRERHGHDPRAGDGLRHAGRRDEQHDATCRSAPRSCT